MVKVKLNLSLYILILFSFWFSLDFTESLHAKPKELNAGDKIGEFNIPPGVKVFPNLQYRDGGREYWQLDLAKPVEKAKEARPAIVFIHGGGWGRGDKRRNLFLKLTIEYASKGYVCVTVNYRLFGEAPLPACIEDVKCAVRWLRAKADKYNIDPDHIGAYGNSAGAHLAAMLCLCPPEANLEGDGPWQEYSSMVQSVVCSATPANILGVYDSKDEQGIWLKERFVRDNEDISDEELMDRVRRCSPINYVSSSSPPFLIIHGTEDQIVSVEGTDMFVKELRKAGAKDVNYLRINGAEHGVFGKNIERFGAEMEKFFKRTLKEKE